MNPRITYWLAILVVFVIPARAIEPPSKLPSTPIAAGQGIALQKLVPSLLELKKQDLTIEFWVKPDRAAIERKRMHLSCLSNRGGSNVKAISIACNQGVPSVCCLGSLLNGASSLVADQWSHVAITLETETLNKRVRLWINGKRVDESLVLQPWPEAFYYARMFDDPWSQQRSFSGDAGPTRISGSVRYRKDFQPAAGWPRDEWTLLQLVGDDFKPQ
ncbi:MAG: LamG-like jellyroll fold domain-containing protein [Pirellulaceae bacterium]